MLTLVQKDCSFGHSTIWPSEFKIILANLILIKLIDVKDFLHDTFMTSLVVHYRIWLQGKQCQ